MDASELNQPYYLKHTVVNDIITDSYVCLVSDSEHCLKGADRGASFATNTSIIQDYKTYYSLPEGAGTNCHFYDFTSSCGGGGGFGEISADDSGNVGVFGSGYHNCNLDNSGTSECH